MQPELRTLLVGDDAEAWAAAGFRVDEDEVRIGQVRVRLTGSAGPRGVHAWELAGGPAGAVDGLPTTVARGAGEALDPPGPAVAHPNHVSRIDHLVVRTPDLERTVEALRVAGFEDRRRRDVPGSDPAVVQVFFWAGEVILELVGPAQPVGDGPARFWGLALACDDLDAAAATLGDRLSPAKAAVQAGRRIATIRTGDLGISTPLALMSPHVP